MTIGTGAVVDHPRLHVGFEVGLGVVGAASGASAAARAPAPYLALDVDVLVVWALAPAGESRHDHRRGDEPHERHAPAAVDDGLKTTHGHDLPGCARRSGNLSQPGPT